MSGKEWIAKFASRKFWVALIGFITTVMVVFNVDSLTREKVISMVSALAVLVAYIIGESMIDTAGVQGSAQMVTLEQLQQLKAGQEVKSSAIGFVIPDSVEEEDDE